MNQQKGVQTAAEIAARGLIGKKKRPAQTGARQTPSGARRCLLPRAVGRGNAQHSGPRGRQNVTPLITPGGFDELLSGSISYAKYLI